MGSEVRPHAYAAERWARAVVRLVDSSIDPPTVASWGRVIGVSRGALRAWCRSAGVTARSSLQFARLLRAVIQSQNVEWDPFNLLDIVDERTLDKILSRAGLPKDRQAVGEISVDQFLEHQRFVERPHLIAAVRASLDQKFRDNH